MSVAPFVMTLREIGDALESPLVGGSCDSVATSVTTDSRGDVKGSVFVALQGDRFDGHAYIEQVKRAGAIAAIVDRRRVADLSITGLPLIGVADPRRALGRLAAVWRQRFSMPLIGVTGSNGKTTTKEMLAAILQASARRLGLPESAVLATRGNLNNDIGLPMMLLGLGSGTRHAVIEMGMNHPGEIAYLAGLAAPTVALVTNAQRAHLEGLGSLNGVAREKASIFASLPDDGVAIINGDDPHADLFREAAGGRRIVVASLDGSGDVVGRYRSTDKSTLVEVTAPEGTVDVELPLLGRHNARNAVIAAAAALAAGATLADIRAGLGEMTNVGGRLRLRAARGGARLLDDTYNANPDSMRAAIDVLAEANGERILVIGDMGEIGAGLVAAHEEVGRYARKAGIDRLLALGEASRDAAKTFGAGAMHYTDIETLVADLTPLLGQQTTVLVKGSRFMRMERIADALAPGSASNGEVRCC